jgi:predicted dehydrogenase
MGSAPRRVSSFGALRHFRAENAPEGSAERCLDCAVEANCPFSARRIYHRLYDEGCRGWPLSVLTPEVNEANLNDALRRGPYGRCVYRCDNNVVDHQVVSIEFAGGQTGVFTMTAFTPPHQERRTRIFGTRGELYCQGGHVEVYDFLTETTHRHDIRTFGNHAGGDEAMVDAFARAIINDDPRCLTTGIDESLASHLAVFAAEQARRTTQVVDVSSCEL